AEAEASKFIHEEYGEPFAAVKERKDKNQEGAQDAHEAIRPSSTMRTPKSLKDVLSRDQYRLYDLIWSRFVASQMTPAVFDTMTVDLSQNGVMFRANGSKMKFEGYRKVYQSTSENSKKDNILPEISEGDKAKLQSNDPAQHFTQPPARFTEAS